MGIYEKTIGIIVPSAGTASEIAYHTYVPKEIAVATARVKFNQISYQDLTEMIDVVKFTAENICATDPDVIVFGSMMASCISGAAIRNIIEQHTGIPCITTFRSLVKVLDRFGYRNLAVVSALSNELGLLLKTNLQKYGVERCEVKTLYKDGQTPYLSIKEIESIPYEVIYQAAKSMDLTGFDAVLFDSSGLQGMDRIPELEAELGLPVLFADQYTLWHALRTIGVDTKLPHLGKIFEY